MENNVGVTYFGILQSADLKESITLFEYRDDYLAFSLFEEGFDVLDRRRVTVATCLDFSISVETLAGSKSVFADECILFEWRVVSETGELSIVQIISVVHLTYNGDLNPDETEFEVEVLVFGDWHGTILLHRCKEYKCPMIMDVLHDRKTVRRELEDDEEMPAFDTDSL